MPDRVITAVEAAELAGISYRQLDHWARKGWVTPSAARATGRASRRLYRIDDVIRLAALRHFGRSGRAMAAIGPLIGTLDTAASFVVMGPDDALLAAADRDELVAFVTDEGSFTTFDVAAFRRRLDDVSADGQIASPQPMRRTA